MKLCSDFFAAGSAKSNLGSFSPLILHKIQKNGVKDQSDSCLGSVSLPIAANARLLGIAANE